MTKSKHFQSALAPAMAADTATAPDLTDRPVAGAVKRAQKICAYCKKPFGQKLFSTGEMESVSCFKRRKFCSMRCAAINRERVKKAVRA